MQVISALETLESLANHNEKENEEISALKKTVERLENDKQVRQQDRIKFEWVITLLTVVVGLRADSFNGLYKFWWENRKPCRTSDALLAVLLFLIMTLV